MRSYSVLLLMTAVCTDATEMPPGALNVLMVIADAWRYSAFGGAEEPDTLALTPKLDAFRASAVDFSRCYAAYPLCTPSRIAIQSGLLISRHNVTKNGAPLTLGTPTVAETFSALGYDTAFFGKWHVGGDGYGSGNAMKLVSLGHRHGFSYWEQGVSQPGSGFGDYRHPVLLTADGTVQGKPGSWEPTFYTDRALQWLNKGRTTSKPFFLTLSWRPPHGPWGFEPKGALEAVMNRYTERLKEAASGQVKKLRNNMPLRRWERPSEKEGLLAMMKGYYAAGQELDHEFGRVLDALEKGGQADSTIVVFASDHGEMLESHELTGKGHWYDESARVPLLVRLPGEGMAAALRTSNSGVSRVTVVGGRLFKGATSLTDVFPTLVSIAANPAGDRASETTKAYFASKRNVLQLDEAANVGEGGGRFGLRGVRGGHLLDGRDLSADLRDCYLGHSSSGAGAVCGTGHAVVAPASGVSTPSAATATAEAGSTGHGGTHGGAHASAVGRAAKEAKEWAEKVFGEDRRLTTAALGRLTSRSLLGPANGTRGVTGGTDGRRRALRSKAARLAGALPGGRIVFSGMPGFWRMATTGAIKVVAPGKSCEPCEERLFVDLLADPFEMRPKKYTHASATGEAWYDAEVLRVEAALMWWCKTGRVDYDGDAAKAGRAAPCGGMAGLAASAGSRKRKPGPGAGLARGATQPSETNERYAAHTGRRPHTAVSFDAGKLRPEEDAPKKTPGKWAKAGAKTAGAKAGAKAGSAGGGGGGGGKKKDEGVPFWKKKLNDKKAKTIS